MRCLTSLAVSKYVEGSLQEGQKERIDEHLTQCVRCSRRVQETQEICARLTLAAQTVGNNPATPHPDDNEVAAYVEGSLKAADRWRLQQHMLECRDCLEGIRMLHQMLWEDREGQSA